MQSVLACIKPYHHSIYRQAVRFSTLCLHFQALRCSCKRSALCSDGKLGTSTIAPSLLSCAVAVPTCQLYLPGVRPRDNVYGATSTERKSVVCVSSSGRARAVVSCSGFRKHVFKPPNQAAFGRKLFQFQPHQLSIAMGSSKPFELYSLKGGLWLDENTTQRFCLKGISWFGTGALPGRFSTV